ncbi:MAG: S1/P1 nuclease [Alphaproteobacteria bacterium]
MKRLAVILAFLALLPAADARAWGPDGHRTVAAIADRFLTAAARRQVATLLAADPDGAADIVAASTWADDYSRAHPETRPFHYVNVPIGAGPYVARQHCPKGACSVAALGRFTATLRDRRASPAARAEALKWVVHLVGDMHQPLHAGDDGDRGGNDVKVRIGERETNLHAVWDFDVVAALPGEGGRPLAEALLARANRRHLAFWSGQGPMRWTVESIGIARGVVYLLLRDRLELPERPITLPDGYIEQAGPIVGLQLLRAGVRLAGLLNATLR